MELTENQVKTRPTYPPKAARTPRVLHPSLALALRQHLTPENSLHRQRSVISPLGCPAMCHHHGKSAVAPAFWPATLGGGCQLMAHLSF